MADPSSLWQEAFDEASQLTYYYNVETGETSWTLPQPDAAEDDLSFMAFAVLRLQSLFRGYRDRRHAVRLLRATYQTTVDPVTQQTLYTDRRSGSSSWTPPALWTRLVDGQGEYDEDGDVDDVDDDDFDTFQRDAEIEMEVAQDGDEGGDGDLDDGLLDGGSSSKKKRRKHPRSLAQQRVDAAEDDDATTALDMSALNAWRLSSRIWNLTALRRLSLAHNHLERIPSGIQDLVHLEHLNLSHNHLTRLPSCLQTTATLTFLDASHNRIASFSPKLWKLRALEELHLGWNALHELPYVEGDLKLLRDTREWQVGVGLLSRLSVLDLSHNRITATPKSIEKCLALQRLDLSYNKLQAIGDELTELSSLTTLTLSHNAVTDLPETLGALAQLTVLAVDSNRLTQLPQTIGNLLLLTDLDLRHNHLQQLPDEFAALGHLQRVALDHNKALAVLPTSLRFLPSIQSFSATHCGLVAFDSVDVLSKAPVRQLALSDNSLLDFPVALQRSAMRLTLCELSLARNSLREFPPELVACVALQRLDLSYNRLRSVPSDIVKLKALRTVELSHNALATLPEAMSRLPKLTELRCAHNSLGSLPLGLGLLSSLQHLDVAANRLTSLPSSLVDLRHSLRSLHASSNQFESVPPSTALLSPACIVDLSNNPFCNAESHADPTHALAAAAVQHYEAKQYEDAEALASSAIELLDGEAKGDSVHHWKRQQERLPRLLLLRGLARFMLAQQAQRANNEASQVIDEQEKALRGKSLLLRRAPQSKSSSPTRRSNQTEPQSDSNNQVEQDGPSLADAIQQRAEARALAADATQGALLDLNRAIALGVDELPTALHVRGRLYMMTLSFAEAIESLSKALQLVDVPAIRLCRAEAYRRLGQLPSALADVECVLASQPSATHVEELLATLSHEWTTQQTQYFVDHDSLFRGYDVDMLSGLPRRPEVHDAHAILTPAQRRQLKQLTPTERFNAAVESLEMEAARAQDATKQRIQDAYAKRVRILQRTRDFKREVRENMAMEVEEATQRAVEKELQRLAELKRQEMDREFNERMYMQYEDELTQWLVAEEKRLEADRLRREEAARRKAEAKAQYETRLARRGGRRQQLAARKTSVSPARGTSPSRK